MLEPYIIIPTNKLVVYETEDDKDGIKNTGQYELTQPLAVANIQFVENPRSIDALELAKTDFLLVSFEGIEGTGGYIPCDHIAEVIHYSSQHPQGKSVNPTTQTIDLNTKTEVPDAP